MLQNIAFCYLHILIYIHKYEEASQECLQFFFQFSKFTQAKLTKKQVLSRYEFKEFRFQKHTVKHSLNH